MLCRTHNQQEMTSMHVPSVPRTIRTAAAATVALTAVALNGVAVAQPAQTESVELFRGCNNVTLTWPTGTNTSDVAAGVAPAAALQSIWRFDNAAQRFSGFSPQFPAQSDYRSVSRIDAVFICMAGPGTLTRPRI